MQPQAPNPDYNFILQNGQPAKKGFKLPGLNLSKKMMIIVGAVVVVVLIIIVAAASGGGGGSSQGYINALARGQEIIRVSTSVNQLATDTPTQNLSATAEASLTGEQAQLTAYLTGQKIKVATAALAADMNSATDTQMQTASTNGNLNTVYASYLKAQLTLYAADLQTAYKTSGPHGQAILSAAYNSVQVLLASPQVSGTS